jgi:hypothetical protein
MRRKSSPIGMDEITEWMNSMDNRNHLQDLLDKYFGGENGSNGYEGRQFEWFVGQSNSAAFTAMDILAIGALSVDIPATTSRRLVEDSSKMYANHLTACREWAQQHSHHSDADWLWADDSPFNNFYEDLRKEEGVGKVVCSKLMAAKFPELIPIRDSKVEALLEYQKVKEWWKPMHHLLLDTLETLNSLHIKNKDIRVTPLRKLDVILWMEAKRRGLK